MAAGEYLIGLGLLALVLAAPICAALAIARRRLASLAGVERLVAVAVIATAILIALHLVPAVLGILDRWVVGALALAVLAAAAMALRREPAPASSAAEPRPSREGVVSRLAAIVAAGTVAIYIVAVLARSHGSLPTFIDTVTFHVPAAVRWIQSGSIWQIDQFLPGQAQGYYPGNGNVVQLAAILPWSSEFLIRFVNVPFYALTGLAVYACGRRLGAPGPSAAVAGAAVVAVPAVNSYIVDSPTPDAVMYATFAAGLLFLLRHASTGARADLLLAGLGLGIAFGSRWYGVSSVAVVVIVWLAAQTVARRWNRRLAADAALMGLTIAAAGGVWLLRNWVEAGNPVFPVEVSILGETIFSAPRDVVREFAGFSIAHYFGDWDALRDVILPGIELQIGYVGAVVALAAFAGLALALRTGPASLRISVIALAVAGFAIAFVYTITPYTALGLEGEPVEIGANVRYLIPALLVAVPVLAWVLGRCGRARPLLEVLVTLIALEALWPGVAVSPANLLAAVSVIGLLGAGAFAVRLASSRDRIAGLAAAAGVAAVVAAALYSTEERLLDDRYTGFAPTLDAALAQAPAGADIGVAGAWPVTTLSPVLALFGTGFENEVEYLGEWRDGFLLPYDSAAGFDAALERGGYDVVMVGLNKPAAYPQWPEERWAAAAGYEQIAADENFVVFAAPES